MEEDWLTHPSVCPAPWCLQEDPGTRSQAKERDSVMLRDSGAVKASLLKRSLPRLYSLLVRVQCLSTRFPKPGRHRERLSLEAKAAGGHMAQWSGPNREFCASGKS